LAERSLKLTRDLSDTYCLSLVLGVLGAIELQGRHWDAARASFTEALDLRRRLGQWHSAADSLWGVAATSVASGDLERGARLLGAEQRMRQESGAPFQVDSEGQRANVWRELHQRGDEPTVSGWVREGQLLARDDAVALALSESRTQDARDPAAAPESPSVLRREGDYWTVVFADQAFKLRDSKGVQYLALLLGSPGREFHALDMASGGRSDPASRGPHVDAPSGHVSGGDAAPVLDEQAKASYRTRLLELEEDLTEATSWADAGRVARINAEIEFLTHELTGALGLHGRDRKAASDAERARVNITRAIHSTLERIRKYNRELAEHLDVTVHTGMYSAYRPDPRAPIRWVSVPDGSLIDLAAGRPAPAEHDAGRR
jgi:non-specific serine/threonine protein kinase